MPYGTRTGWLDDRATLAQLIALSHAEALARLSDLVGPAAPPDTADVLEDRDGGVQADLTVEQGLTAAVGVLVVTVLYALLMRHLGR